MMGYTKLVPPLGLFHFCQFRVIVVIPYGAVAGDASMLVDLFSLIPNILNKIIGRRETIRLGKGRSLQTLNSFFIYCFFMYLLWFKRLIAISINAYILCISYFPSGSLFLPTQPKALFVFCEVTFSHDIYVTYLLFLYEYTMSYFKSSHQYNSTGK